MPAHAQRAAGQIQEAGTEAVFVRGNPGPQGGETRTLLLCLNFKLYVRTSDINIFKTRTWDALLVQTLYVKGHRRGPHTPGCQQSKGDRQGE